MRRWLTGVTALVLAAALLTCNGDGEEKDGGWKYDGFQLDGNCTRPPLSMCDEPPNASGKNLWYCRCSGYCGGGAPTAGCNASTNDCRFFADSCLPKEYSYCDQNATDYIFGLCGACFFLEAGTRNWTDKLPKVCDQMQLDGGSISKDNGAKDAAAKDAAAKDAPAKDSAGKDAAAAQ